jgi:membrane protease subunit HflK
MPWNNQGSGGGGKGPWGSGPQQSGPATPDLEEFRRRSQDRLRSVLPGGSGKGPGLNAGHLRIAVGPCAASTRTLHLS